MADDPFRTPVTPDYIPLRLRVRRAWDHVYALSAMNAPSDPAQRQALRDRMRAAAEDAFRLQALLDSQGEAP